MFKRIITVNDYAIFERLDDQDLKEGEFLVLKWPDGSTERAEVCLDLHKNEDQIPCRRAYAMIKYRGTELRANLAGLRAQRAKAPRRLTDVADRTVEAIALWMKKAAWVKNIVITTNKTDTSYRFSIHVKDRKFTDEQSEYIKRFKYIMRNVTHVSCMISIVTDIKEKNFKKRILARIPNVYCLASKGKENAG